MTAPFTVIIPSRYGSTRLPGKALIPIHGKPLVQHAFEAAEQSAAGSVVIATDHEGIAGECRAFGARVLMTSGTHQSGTDRIAEVADRLGLEDSEVIVNVQGDQRRLPPRLINQVAGILLDHPGRVMATVCEPFDSEEDARNPNRVKVDFDASGKALSFTRDYVPRGRPGAPWGYRHVGLYAYRAGFLRRFTRLPPSPSEQRERLEQLRAMDNGFAIYVEIACAPAGAEVDTPEDVMAAEGESAATWSADIFTTSRGK